jgi:PIN domain nuclease of toxin-antitoxin system
MNYLLDTHVFLWWITGASGLSAAAQQTLSQAAGRVLVSVVSLWEMAIKIKLGKLKMPEPFETYVLRQLQKNRMEILPIHAPHVFETLQLPPHHRDPFDRLIVAQARREDLLLISGDEALRAYDVKILW